MMRHTHIQSGRHNRLLVAALTLGAAALTTTAPSALTASGAPNTIERVSEPQLQQYRAFRRMYARSEKLNQEAWMDAWTELDGRSFRYQIVQERGSDAVRSRVLRTLLQREQELIASGEPARAALTLDNYNFAGQTAGPGVRYVGITPKRNDVLLVDGRMVLSEDGRELLRVEGVLSKNPSFWTSLVNVIRHYARLEGVRVPIATESVAKVKLAGLSKLKVEYEYETINGRTVSSAARRTLAANITR